MLFDSEIDSLIGLAKKLNSIGTQVTELNYLYEKGNLDSSEVAHLSGLENSLKTKINEFNQRLKPLRKSKEFRDFCICQIDLINKKLNTANEKVYYPDQKIEEWTRLAQGKKTKNATHWIIASASIQGSI